MTARHTVRRSRALGAGWPMLSRLFGAVQCAGPLSGPHLACVQQIALDVPGHRVREDRGKGGPGIACGALRIAAPHVSSSQAASSSVVRKARGLSPHAGRNDSTGRRCAAPLTRSPPGSALGRLPGYGRARHRQSRRSASSFTNSRHCTPWPSSPAPSVPLAGTASRPPCGRRQPRRSTRSPGSWRLREDRAEQCRRPPPSGAPG